MRAGNAGPLIAGGGESPLTLRKHHKARQFQRRKAVPVHSEAMERGRPGFEERRKSEGYVDRTIDRATDFLSRLRERGHSRSR